MWETYGLVAVDIGNISQVSAIFGFSSFVGQNKCDTYGLILLEVIE